MNKKQKITYSIIAASIITAGEVIYRKIGGHAAGGIYSDPHTWGELAKRIPSFIAFFAIIFLVLLTYELLGKNKTNAICPKCRECFATPDIKSAICPKCFSKAEKLEGFYEKHPDFHK
jgi:hypothetical protein